MPTFLTRFFQCLLSILILGSAYNSNALSTQHTITQQHRVLIIIPGAIDDYSFSQAAYQGVQQLSLKLQKNILTTIL